MKGLILAAALALSVGSVEAQNGNDGWRRFGEALGSRGARSDEAYRERMLENARLQQAAQELRAMQSQTQLMQLQADLRQQLQGYWIAMGLTETEAQGVASSFEIRPELTAMLERAKRDGSKATIAAAVAAYERYDYQLANQLVLAATREGVPLDPAGVGTPTP